MSYKSEARLARRLAVFKPGHVGKTGKPATHRPGSQNPHKPSARGNGKKQ